MSDDDTETTPPTDNLAQLRARAEAATAAEQRATAAERRLAFLEAGADLSKPLVTHLFNTYQGEPTKEAAESFLTSMGVLGQAPAPAPAYDASFTAQRQQLAMGGDPAGIPPDRQRTDPYDLAMWNKSRGLQQGQRSDDLLAQGVAVVMGAAALGDSRVIIQPARTGYADPRRT